MCKVNKRGGGVTCHLMIKHGTLRFVGKDSQKLSGKTEDLAQMARYRDVKRDP